MIGASNAQVETCSLSLVRGDVLLSSWGGGRRNTRISVEELNCDLEAVLFIRVSEGSDRHAWDFSMRQNEFTFPRADLRYFSRIQPHHTFRCRSSHVSYANTQDP